MSNVFPMVTRKPTVFMHIQADVKAALETAAREDGRSLSNLIERICADWLNANGYPEIKLTGPGKAGRISGKAPSEKGGRQ